MRVSARLHGPHLWTRSVPPARQSPVMMDEGAAAPNNHSLTSSYEDVVVGRVFACTRDGEPAGVQLRSAFS